MRYFMFIVAAFVLGFFTMLFWNALVPGIFHGPELSYWQAVGLLVLARLLTGGGHHGWRPWKHWAFRRWRKHGWNMGSGPDYCGPWQGGWQRWAAMSPEER